MKLSRIKLVTLYLLLASLIASVLIIYIIFGPKVYHGEDPQIGDQFTPLLLKVVGVYSVNLAIVFSSYFTGERGSRNTVVSEKHWIAFSLILTWDIGFMVYLVYSGINLEKIYIEIFNTSFDKIISSINFLVAGALVFLFKKQ